MVCRKQQCHAKDLMMANELQVWLFADHVGTLFLRDGRLNFRYDPAWLGQSNAVALSVSLPLRAEPFDDHQNHIRYRLRDPGRPRP